MYRFRFKELRQDTDLRQEDVAKILNTSQRQYSRWEIKNKFTPEDIIRLAKFYKVSTDYLLGLTNNKKRNY